MIGSLSVVVCLSGCFLSRLDLIDETWPTGWDGNVNGTKCSPEASENYCVSLRILWPHINV